jgi:hypothetical protein
VAAGRNIIRADDVAATTRKLGDLVHGRFEPSGGSADLEVPREIAA